MKKKTVIVPLPKPSRVHERNPRRPLVDIFDFSGYLAIYLVFISISIPKENLNPPDIGQNNGGVNK